MTDFRQIAWGGEVEQQCRTLVRLAAVEDLGDGQDWTTVSLVSEERTGRANVVAREDGIAAGIPVIGVVIDEMQARLDVETYVQDGDTLASGATIASLHGNVRQLLTCERTMLNFLGRLMGVATLARQYVDRIEGGTARIYDTRKTTPGWRLLEKYAVRCGGANNHRLGLHDAVLIKDNHLAQGGRLATNPAGAVDAARQLLHAQASEENLDDVIVEIEVDTLDQLAAVLPANPDIVLLDNMSIDELQAAVGMRDAIARQIQLEASGGVGLETVAQIASTGVDRISVGALTHSARSLDIGLDWQDG